MERQRTLRTLRAVDWREVPRGLVDGAVAGDDEVLDAGAFEGDRAEGLLILRDVIAEDV